MEREGNWVRVDHRMMRAGGGGRRSKSVALVEDQGTGIGRITVGTRLDVGVAALIQITHNAVQQIRFYIYVWVFCGSFSCEMRLLHIHFGYKGAGHERGLTVIEPGALIFQRLTTRYNSNF